MSGSRARHVRLIGLVAAALVLTGCSTVVVDEPTPEPEAARICGAVMQALPSEVLDQGRRSVEPGVLTAAWGKPAIVLRCGVPAPAGLTRESECLEVNGVGWFDEDATGGKIFTTIGRPAYVELLVPSRYAPESGALADLSDVVSTHDPTTTPCQ